MEPNDPLLQPASQATTRFPIEPVSAETLCRIETKRRDRIRRRGGCGLGCREVDEEVLVDGGGFERGCVVGVSSEDEDFGVSLALQVVARALCEGTKERALVVSTGTPAAVARPLRDVIAREMGLAGGKGDVDVGGILERVQIVRVFDVEGLWDVVADLDAAPVSPEAGQEDILEPDEALGQEHEVEQPAEKKDDHHSEKVVEERQEIPDSEDEYSPLATPEATEEPTPAKPLAEPEKEVETKRSEEPQPGPETATTTPSIILITHFSTLLTTLFTHTEKSAAHTTLQLLSARLRYLTRTLSSDPLVLITNSTTSSSSDQTKPLDPTLRSVFDNPPPVPYGGGQMRGSTSRSKPSFGLVFSQFLDVHLLCTRVARRVRDAEMEVVGGGGGGGGDGGDNNKVWVVECLLDEDGVWTGERGPRMRRERRWGVVDVVGGRIVDGRV